MITVATWNVLHRVHAENWGEPVVRHWPDETTRIAAVTALVAARPEQVIALQEVSGDQLASLREALPDRTAHTLRYPRFPRLRRGGHRLRDAAEHLVLLVAGPSRLRAAVSFPDDPGKGALAVAVPGALVVATHLSTDGRGCGQLRRLAKLADLAPGEPAVLLGDFNADPAAVAAGVGDAFTVAALPADAPPTRPGPEGSPFRWIDHVVVRGARATDTAVVDVAGCSDHNLVRATIS